MVVFIYVNRIEINIELLISYSNKYNFHLKIYFGDFFSLVQAAKYDKLSLQVNALHNLLSSYL